MMNKTKIIQMVILLAAITVIVGSLCRMLQNNSMSLTEYQELHGTSLQESENQNKSDPDDPTASETEKLQTQTASPEPSPAPSEIPSSLTGALLNTGLPLEERTVFDDGFYHEPISDALSRYMTGVSYPSADSVAAQSGLVVTFDDLRYLHILYIDFDGNPAEGELICHSYIADDLAEIFYQLYRNEYQLESVLLIDEFNGDDAASMEANNTSCFNYRNVDSSANLSRHAYGLAIDINPYYNPYVTYEKDGTENVSPAAALSYADRSISFAYKIDEDDICYKLFTEHGFIWGGNWNNVKDYQHFQKSLPQ